jgi:hypothetical protein
LPALWTPRNRNHAHRRLPVLLRLQGLWCGPAAERWRLLCVLLLRLSTVPADAGSTGKRVSRELLRAARCWLIRHGTAVDLIGIGTRTAARFAAMRCRAAGWTVVVIDCKPVGGTCALRGARLLQGYRKALLLRGLARYETHYECFRGLGCQHAHEAIGVGASSRRVGCRTAGRGAGSNGHLDRRPRLDGRCMHPQCAALRSNALPVHRAVLSLYDYSGARARAGCRSGRPIWMAGSRRLHYPRQQNDMVGDGARAGKVLVDSRYQYWSFHPFGHALSLMQLADVAWCDSWDLSGCRKTLLLRGVSRSGPRALPHARL